MPALSVRQSCALAIGGLDPGGGAGIVADLRAFSAAGAFGCAVVTLTTVQSTAGLESVQPIPARDVLAQGTEVLRSQDVRGIKIGALGTRENVAAVVRLVTRHPEIPVVVDTPMVPTRGRASLLEKDALPVVVRRLFPKAALLTVNLQEAGVFLGRSIRTAAEARHAAQLLAGLGPRAVLVKGGHLRGPVALDALVVDGKVLELRSERIRVGPVHGTGCTLASLIAGHLAAACPAGRQPRTSELVAAVRWAKRRHHRALARAAKVGLGMRALVF